MSSFDKNKSLLEKKIEQCINILTRTYPEQLQDAMQDYLKIILILNPIKQNDWRVISLLSRLDRLYVYPNRKEHNELVNEIHEVKEELHEARIQKNLEKHALQGTEAVSQSYQGFPLQITAMAGITCGVIIGIILIGKYYGTA